MNQTDPNLIPKRRLNPLIVTAAAAVIVASLAATAAITGVFPKASSNTGQTDQTQTGQTAMMASPSVIDSTQPAPKVQSVQLAQNGAPATGQATATAGAPPAQYAQQPQPTQQQTQQPMRQSTQQPMQQQYGQQGRQAHAPCESCGTVEAISAVKHEGHGTGIGAVGGAVAGGVVGNQFGSGNGRVAMTLLGALGGGVGGNAIEKHLRSTTSYSVRVHMDSGKTRYFSYRQPPPFQQGEHVRISHGTLVAG